MQIIKLSLLALATTCALASCSSFGVVEPTQSSKNDRLFVSNTNLMGAKAGITDYKLDSLGFVSAENVNSGSEDGNGITYNRTRNIGFQVDRGTKNIIAFMLDSAEAIKPFNRFSDVQLNSARGVAYDGQRDILYVADHLDSAIVIYENASTLKNNISATRRLKLYAKPWGITLAGNDMLVAMDGEDLRAVQRVPNIASTTTPPVRDIGTMYIVGAKRLHGITYDAPTNTLLVTDIAMATPGMDSLAVPFNLDGSIFIIENASAKFSDSVVFPTRTISGTNTFLGNPVDIAYDGRPGRETIYVAEKSRLSILIFDGKKSGNVAPKSTLGAFLTPESLYFLKNLR